MIYKDTLFAYYPSTNPEAYLQSLETIAALPSKRLFPAHHSLDIQPEIAVRIRDAFRELKVQGKLHHGAEHSITAIGRYGCKINGVELWNS